MLWSVSRACACGSGLPAWRCRAVAGRRTTTAHSPWSLKLTFRLPAEAIGGGRGMGSDRTLSNRCPGCPPVAALTVRMVGFCGCVAPFQLLFSEQIADMCLIGNVGA